MKKTSYWHIFRIVFVMFSLFLLGDAFYRWDGFRYYATFTEFLPGCMLITVLWSIIAASSAFIIWLLLIAIEPILRHIGWKIKASQILLFISLFIFLGILIWTGKKFLWPLYWTPFKTKQLLFLTLIIVSILLTFLFRNKSDTWLKVISENITSLVWLFGIWVFISLSMVSYYAWGKKADNMVSQKTVRPYNADKILPNFILVTFDALTARDMSVYGYHLPTTPYITEWTKKATVFTKVKSSSNYTAPSVSSLMTMKQIWTHKVYQPHAYKPLKVETENAALLLNNSGYYNMAFVVNHQAAETLDENSFNIIIPYRDLIVSYSFLDDFDRLLSWLFDKKIINYNWILNADFIFGRLLYKIQEKTYKITVTGAPVEIAFNKVIKILNDNPQQPYFIWIHLLPPHDAYLPPEPYMGMFDSSSQMRTFTEQRNAIVNINNQQQKFLQFTSENQPVINTLRARYDEFIRYCDARFEEFIKKISDNNKMNNTVIILSSDHGESFDHNYLTHGSPYHLYESSTHIPLIIKLPNQTSGQVVHDLVSQPDITATILDLADILLPSWAEARSLLPLIRGEKFSQEPVFSANFVQNHRDEKLTKGTIAVWENNYKLIHYLESNKSLLFNLKQDPDELNNLIGMEPEIGQRLLGLIHVSLKEANERITMNVTTQ